MSEKSEELYDRALDLIQEGKVDEGGIGAKGPGDSA